MINDHISDGLKHGLDLLSIATLLGTLVSVLPSIAAGLTIVWTLLRIYESPTVTGWLERRRRDK